MYKNRLEFPMTPAGGFGNSVKNNFVSGHFFSLSFAGTDTKCWGLLFSLAFWRHGECVYKSNFPRFFFIFNARHRKDIVAGLYKVPVCMRTANTENLNLHFLVPQFFLLLITTPIHTFAVFIHSSHCYVAYSKMGLNDYLHPGAGGYDKRMRPLPEGVKDRIKLMAAPA